MLIFGKDWLKPVRANQILNKLQQKPKLFERHDFLPCHSNWIFQADLDEPISCNRPYRFVLLSVTVLGFILLWLEPMISRFTVLASGSAGNANFLQTDSFGLLIDCGLRPQELTARLQMVGATWQSVNAVVLTHTHTDHWNKFTLEHLRRLNIPLLAHAKHHAHLAVVPQYAPLAHAGLVRSYEANEPYQLDSKLTMRAVQVPHDSDPTLALRIDSGDPVQPTWSVGLASDLGKVHDNLLSLLRGVDVLAIEFNHDEAMERASRRPRFLVDRVLSDFGHLSNRQAGEAVQKLVNVETLLALFQLHLSRDCNTPELAAEAGRLALSGISNAPVITASQLQPTVTIQLMPRSERSNRKEAVPSSVQRYLPGLEPETDATSQRAD
jgi:phosphoribosyl 1,2-cyclic phosphodiesterase